MNTRIIYAILVGIVLYSLVIVLAYVEQTLRIEQLLLIIITPIIVGIVSGSVKMGAALGFVLSLLMFTAEGAVLSGGDVGVILAIVVSGLLFVVISAGLGAVGGLIGRRMKKK